MKQFIKAKQRTFNEGFHIENVNINYIINVYKNEQNECLARVDYCGVIIIVLIDEKDYNMLLEREI